MSNLQKHVAVGKLSSLGGKLMAWRHCCLASQAPQRIAASECNGCTVPTNGLPGYSSAHKLSAISVVCVSLSCLLLSHPFSLAGTSAVTTCRAPLPCLRVPQHPPPQPSAHRCMPRPKQATAVLSRRPPLWGDCDRCCSCEEGDRV